MTICSASEEKRCVSFRRSHRGLEGSYQKEKTTHTHTHTFPFSVIATNCTLTRSSNRRATVANNTNKLKVRHLDILSPALPSRARRSTDSQPHRGPDTGSEACSSPLNLLSSQGSPARSDPASPAFTTSLGDGSEGARERIRNGVQERVSMRKYRGRGRE